jgi:hypothetical protein
MIFMATELENLIGAGAGKRNEIPETFPGFLVRWFVAETLVERNRDVQNEIVCLFLLYLALPKQEWNGYLESWVKNRMEGLQQG